MKKKNVILIVSLLILFLVVACIIIIINNLDNNEQIKSPISVGDYVAYNLDNTSLTEKTKNDLQQYSGFSELYGLSDEDYLENFPITQDSLNWRVLSINNDKITLISDMPSKSKVFLHGYNGYNNAIYLLNKICSDLYSSDYGTARSLNINDVIETLSFDYSSLDNYGKSFVLHKGLNNKNSYPNMFNNEKNLDNLDSFPSSQDEIVEGFSNNSDGELEVTNTYWSKDLDKNSFKQQIYYDLFVNENNFDSYVLASRCVSSVANELAQFSLFGFNLLKDSNISNLSGNNVVYNSKEDLSSCWLSFRPVITLNNDVYIEECNGENSLSNPHVLVKKSES